MVDYRFDYGPLDIANHVQQQGDMGRQRGQQSFANRLLGQAYNAPDAAGFVEIFNGEALVYVGTGRNTWAGTSITEPNPPYLKAGVYQPGPGSSWWDGKAATMYYPVSMVVDDGYSVAQLRQWVNRQLADNSNSLVLLAN